MWPSDLGDLELHRFAVDLREEGLTASLVGGVEEVDGGFRCATGDGGGHGGQRGV